MGAVILDIMDSNKVLVDGPSSGIERGLMSLKHLSLTAIRCPVPRSVKTATLTKLMAKHEIEAKWGKTSWARKIKSAASRGNLSDFDRFKVMVLRKKRSAVVGKELAKLVKSK